MSSTVLFTPAAAREACSTLGATWETHPRAYVFQCRRHNIIAPRPLARCPVCDSPVTTGVWNAIETPVRVERGRLAKMSANMREKRRKHEARAAKL